MGARFRWLWQQIKQHRVTILVVAIILIVAISLIIVGYRFDWTGFNGNNKSGKTLWDWMQLLIIPIMFAIGGFWLNQIQKSREQRTTQQQAELERELTRDNQQETLLQAYIDKMSELLLKEGLRESQPEDEVRKIARVRTLTVLQRLDRLDEIRKRSLLQFLYEANLIDKDNAIVDASGADLDFVQLFIAKEDEDFPRRYGDNLHRANLHKADLYKAELSEAELSEADLRRAALRRANLRGADLRGVSLCDYILMEANRENADLQGTDLSDAELSGADLSKADLSGANLSGATVTTEQLEQAKSLKGATMPDGSKHP